MIVSMPSEHELINQLNQNQPVLAAGPDWVRVVISLLLVLGLCVFILKRLKPWLQAQKISGQAISPTQRIVLHHAIRLGAGSALHTVSVNGQTFLIGTGPNQSPRLISAILAQPPDSLPIMHS
jgi:flagellar biogenesis protein FliO